MKIANEKLIYIFSRVLLALLILIPLGLVYRTIEAIQFVESCESCRSWSGVLYFVLIPAEFYLLLIFWWLRSLRRQRSKEALKFIQLLLILILGILPGLVLLYPAFIKD